MDIGLIVCVCVCVYFKICVNFYVVNFNFLLFDMNSQWNSSTNLCINMIYLIQCILTGFQIKRIKRVIIKWVYF